MVLRFIGEIRDCMDLEITGLYTILRIILPYSRMLEDGQIHLH